MNVKEIEGVEVDVCSLCEGIYIDKDEIEHFVMTQKKEPTNFIKKLLGLKK